MGRAQEGLRKQDFNTYGKKGKTKHSKPLINISIKNVFLQFSTHYTFSTTKSSSGDEFDHLMKGPIYHAPNQSSAFTPSKGKYFVQRQDTISMYHSDHTLDSSHSMRLFKDVFKKSADMYASSCFLTPSSYCKKKKKLVKCNTLRNHRVKKRKPRKAIKKRSNTNVSTIASTASSTPTHPQSNLRELQVSPILSPIYHPKDDSSSDSVGSFVDNEENEKFIHKFKQKPAINVSALVDGFCNLGLATPFPKAKEVIEEKGNHKEIFKAAYCHLTTDKIENNYNQELKPPIQKINCTRNSLSHLDNSHKQIETNKGKSLDSSLKNNVLLEIFQNISIPISCNSNQTHLSESIKLKSSFESNSCTESKIGVSSDKNIEDVPNLSFKVESRHYLDRDKEQISAGSVKSCHSLKSLSKLDDNVLLKTEEKTQYNTSIIKEIDHSKISDGLKQLPDPASKNSLCLSDRGLYMPESRIALQPGKRWRRSFLTLKQEDMKRYSLNPNVMGTKRSSVGPAFLLKLLKNAAKNSYVENKARSPLNTTYTINTLQETNENLNCMANDSIFDFSRISSILNNTFEFSKLVNIRPRKAKINSAVHNNGKSLGGILEESSYEASCKNSLDSVQEDPLVNKSLERSSNSHRKSSDLSLSKNCTISENPNINVISKETTCETPPILKLSTDAFDTITKRKKKRVRSRQSLDFFQEEELCCYDQPPKYLCENKEDVLDEDENQITIGSFLFNDEDIDLLVDKLQEEDIHPMGEVGVLLRCGLKDHLAFDQVFPEADLLKAQKIGEGVFGEVFMLERPFSGKSVVKIIPVEGSRLVNGEPQTHFGEVLSELIITEELSRLRDNQNYQTSGFCELKNKFSLKGKYPSRLIDLWHDFDKSKGSENDCPDMFDSSQLYVALELEHAGEPVESYKFTNARQTYSVFLQTAFSLAVAESSLMFEHRDLHIGNVLVKTTTDAWIHFIHNGYSFKIPSFGIKATIIDYTLSRVTLENDVLFFDLAKDPELFIAEGDYQFEIYRLMREDLDDNWERHAPVTNIRWLHYLLDKFVNKSKYRNKKTKQHTQYCKKLNDLKNLILEYVSSGELAEFLFQTYLDSLSIITFE